MNISLGEKIKQWREAAGLTQEQFSERLRISRNYVSLIENDAKTPSPHLMAQIDRMITGVDPVGMVQEQSQGAYGDAGSLTAEIRRHMEQLIAATRGDVGRLGWVREEQLKHLSPPEHWGLLQQALEAEIQREQNSRQTQHSAQSPLPKTQGGAGR